MARKAKKTGGCRALPESRLAASRALFALISAITARML